MRTSLFALALIAASIATVASASAQTFQGKVWFVSTADAVQVRFPPPSAQEDIDFSTNGIAYIGQGTSTGPESCVTIGTFLSSCSTPTVPPGVTNGLHFTGFVNPILGNTAATANTPMNTAMYGEIIEFKGSVYLSNGQEIQILHDDGVALAIDGVLIKGFDSETTPAILETVKYTGTSGTHSIDLLYANVADGRSDGFWILFLPKYF